MDLTVDEPQYGTPEWQIWWENLSVFARNEYMDRVLRRQPKPDPVTAEAEKRREASRKRTQRYRARQRALKGPKPPKIPLTPEQKRARDRAYQAKHRAKGAKIDPTTPKPKLPEALRMRAAWKSWSQKHTGRPKI
jgi:hypothetical protein